MTYRLHHLLLCFFCLAQLSLAQTNQIQGLPMIHNYGSEDYNAGIQNWAIVQHENGLLYVANNLGLLEYDGIRWELHQVENKTKVRSILIDQDGKIYVGSQRDFGYFSSTSQGRLIYTSLADSLATDLRDFDETWKIYKNDEAIYFCTFQKIFSYDGKDLKVISSEYPLEISFLHENQIITQQWGLGLSRVVSDKLELLPGTEFFKDKRISNIFNYDNSSWLVSTFNNGLYHYNNGMVTPFEVDKSLDLGQLIVNYSKRLSNGQIALGTQNGGLIIIDKQGEVLLQLDQSKGLNDGTVNFIYEDLQGNLWLTLNNGLARVDLYSPFSFIDNRTGITGAGYAAYAAQEGLYLGTNNGLFLKNGQKLDLINGTSGQVYAIQKLNGTLLVGHHEGPMEVIGKNAKMLSREKGAWIFKQYPGHHNVVIQGTYTGINSADLSSLKTSGFQEIKGFEESSRIMEFDDEYLWITQGYKGAFRLKLSDDLKEVEEVKLYNSQNGFPSDLLINVYKINSRLVFTAEQGFFEYDKSEDRFIPLTHFNELLGEESSMVDMEADEVGNIYFIERAKLGVLKPKGNFSYEVHNRSFNKVKKLWNDDLANVTVLDNENVLIGAHQGFILYNPAKDLPKNDEFNVMLRQVVNSGRKDSVLNYGHIAVNKVQENTPTFSFAQNSFAFSFAAPHFESDQEVRYQFRLENYDEQWSEWSYSNFKEYTNLREGDYTFQVRALNIFDTESPITSYSFSISPPIYRTGFAYAFYGLGTLMLLFTGFKMLEKKHKREAKALEDSKNREIEQKDSEIEHITQKSEEEIIKLRNAKLRAEIALKSQALTSSAMHLIQKNQLLSQIKNTLKNLDKEQNDRQLTTQFNRIVKSIDRDLSSGEEWDQFQNNFDQVHGNFITRLKERYPGLTPQELKFSAYIRMNLNTKEIANLLNISVRGVEIGRYRVRKKLELTRQDNLSDFLLRF